jgi:hypothetical protein
MWRQRVPCERATTHQRASPSGGHGWPSRLSSVTTWVIVKTVLAGTVFRTLWVDI